MMCTMSRITGSMTIVLAVMCAMPCPSIADPTPQQIASYQKKISSYTVDLAQMFERLSMGDFVHALELTQIGNQYFYQLEHIKDLLLINGIVHSPDDKELIKLFTINRIKSVADDIDFSIKQVNATIASIRNQAVIATGTKLRDDLRALKELLLSSN
jgi:hypothetical protein